MQLETGEELLRWELEAEVCSPCGQEVWEQATGEAAKVYRCPQGMAHSTLTVPEYFFGDKCVMQTSLANKFSYLSGNFRSDCFHSKRKYSLKNYTRNVLDAAVLNIHT